MKPHIDKCYRLNECPRHEDARSFDDKIILYTDKAYVTNGRIMAIVPNTGDRPKEGERMSVPITYKNEEDIIPEECPTEVEKIMQSIDLSEMRKVSFDVLLLYKLALMLGLYKKGQRKTKRREKIPPTLIVEMYVDKDPGTPSVVKGYNGANGCLMMVRTGD